MTTSNLLRHLYGIIGVEETATTAEIRVAYRRLSKTVHPDAGGDQVQFERIKLAHDVLTDAKRRARYDETGEFTEASADNAHMKLYTQLGGLLDEVMEPAVASGKDPSQIDVVEMMREALQARLERVAQLRAGALRVNPMLLKAVKRFTVKGDGKNVLAEIFAARVAKIEQLLEDFAKADAETQALVTFLDDYGFDVERPPLVTGNTVLNDYTIVGDAPTTTILF